MISKLAIKIVPTPTTRDISEANLTRLSRITKLSSDRLLDKISRGKSIIIVTPDHPRVNELTTLIKSFGFSVNVTPADAVTQDHVIPQLRVPTKLTKIKNAAKTEWQVGDVIENLYEVLDIKQGGMGAVYVVRHKRWNNTIAVKSLLHKLRGHDEDKALFVKEAETWIDIGFHPNIAACYYVRNILGSPRIFIEYVDGGGLNEWLIRRRPVGWDTILDLMVQVSDGLHHAHSKGLVHRDVKPANCMMTSHGVLKVTDFGLTKRQNLDAITDKGIDPTDSVTIERESVTAAGMGTPGYMAPEMWIPYSEVGPPADIYAFGVMFFEICCGRKPFLLKPGQKRDKLALAHVKKTPPNPTSIRKEIPISIEKLILKCLNKDPEQRYASFRLVREELAYIYQRVCKKKYTREPPNELNLLSDALNNRAVSLMDLNHEDEAEAALKRALQADPHHPEAVYNLGLLHWIKTGSPDSDFAVRLDEVTKTPEYVGRGGTLLARCLLAQGAPEKALNACEIAFASGDKDYSRLKQYGIALIGVGKEEEAVKQLDIYLDRFEADEEALGWIIGALFRLNRKSEAQQLLDKTPAGSELKSMSLDSIAAVFVFSSLKEDFVASGHVGWITCIAHAPISNYCLTGGRDRRIKLWEPAHGKELRTINVVGEPPAALWIAPNEKYVAVGTAQSNGPIRLLNLETGKFAGNLSIPDGTVTSLAFFPDGNRIITVEQKGAVRLWDISEGKSSQSFKIAPHSVSAICFNESDAPEIIFVGMDRVIKKVKIPKSNPESFDRLHKEAVTILRLSPDGSKAVTAGKDKQVIVWNTGTGAAINGFQGHSEVVSLLDLHPTGNTAASYDSKSGIKLWDMQTGMSIRNYPLPETEMLALKFSNNGDKLFAAGKDMQLRAWDVRGRSLVPEMALAKVMPVTKQMQSDHKFKIMIDTAKKAVKHGRIGIAYQFLRDTQKLRGYERADEALNIISKMQDIGKRTGLRAGWQKMFVDTGSAVMAVNYSSSGINFLTAQADYTVRMWRAKTLDCVRVLNGHTNLVAAVAFSASGRELASAGDDRTIRIWDAQTSRRLSILKGHTESVGSVAFSGDGSLLLSGSWDKTVRLWRLPEGNLVKTLKGHEDKISSVAFINQDRHILSAGFDGIIKMWDSKSGRALRELKGYKDKVLCLSVSRDGEVLAGGSGDGVIKIWDIKTGACLKTIELSVGVRAVDFSPDGLFLAAGCVDSGLRIWNIHTTNCEREFLGHTKELTDVRFSPNGRYIISASSDANVMIWELDWNWDFPRKIKRTHES